MAITRVNFASIANGGDSPTAAFVKLDANVADLDARVTASMPSAGGQFTGDVTFAAGKKLTVAGLLTASGGLTVTGATAVNGAFSAATVTTTGDVTAGGQVKSLGGTVQIGNTAGAYSTLGYDGKYTNSVSTVPANGFNTLAFKVNGNFGGGYGMKDGTSNIGWWSNSGNLIFGFGTNDGVMTEQARVTTSGFCQYKGYQCRTGTSGGYGGNFFNFNWSGGLTAYVDTSSVGNVQLGSSDYRIKDPSSIEPTDGRDLEVVLQWRPVTWRYADVGAWQDDGRVRRSFIAHELGETDETLVIGEKDAVDEEGKIIPQQVDMLAVMSRLAGAVQTLARQNAELHARIETLEKTHG